MRRCALCNFRNSHHYCTLQEFERRISALQKVQTRERQFSDSRLKEHLLHFEKVEAENGSLKEQLRSAMAYKERSRTHESRTSQERKPSRKPSIVPTESSVSRAHSVSKAGPPKIPEALRAPPKNAKSPVQAPKSTVAPVQRAEPKMPIKTRESAHIDVNNTSDSAAKKSWKPRTSPDLLKDHEERIVFSDLPSSSSSMASSASVVDSGERSNAPSEMQQFPEEENEPEIPTPKRKLSTAKPSAKFSVEIDEDFPAKVAPLRPENVMKNELLEKIRLLDVGKRESSAKKIEGRKRNYSKKTQW